MIPYVSPRFVAHYDDEGNQTGIEILDDWPRMLLIDDELINSLKQTNHEWARLCREGDELHFRCVNGQARYRYVRREGLTTAWWEGVE